MNDTRLIKIIFLAICLVSSSGCVQTNNKSVTKPKKRYKLEQDIGPHALERIPNMAKVPDAKPKHEPKSKIGNPKTYTVFNKTYCVLPTSKGYKERGTASWYGKKFHGYHTSSGEVYDMYGMSAAHKTLPLPTYAKVTNLKNGKSVIVKINDRGPFHEDRLIDLSYAAAAKLGILATGTSQVEIHAIDPTQQKLPQLFFQIGAFDLEQNAQKLANQIQRITKDKNHTVTVNSSKTKAGKKYHVHVGPLHDETVILELSKTLSKNNIPKPQRIHR